MRAAVILWCALCLSCAAPAPLPIPQVKAGLNIAACTVGEAGPGIVDAVKVLLDGPTSTAEKVIAGILGAGGTLAKGYACYLREAATLRTQAGETVIRSDREVIDSRARYCEESGPDTCKWNYKAAWLLARLCGKDRQGVCP